MFAVGGLWWLVTIIGKMPQALGKLWLLVSMALGVIFVWMMTGVYQIDTVPTWHNGYTTLAFFLTVLLSGPILAAAILRAARVTFNTTPFAIISVLALIACAGVIVLQGLSLASIHSSSTTSQRTGTRLRLLTGLACGIVMHRSRMLALSAHSSP
ncbi:dimethyl sulfoxide reductase anchor subunit [Escherichia coli]|nr:dimethyl sulfoxide reductase anchor subunit [Escherichia coli]